MAAMTWEQRRSWHLMRRFVYYLVEDLVAPSLVAGKDVLDFSAGLGDLSAYMAAAGASSVTATRPEDEVPESGVTWVPGVAAGNIAERLPASSFDVAVARMVFQFPTWEGDRADPDTMTEEFAAVLRPGGLLILAFHEFIPFEPTPALGESPTVDQVLAMADPWRQRLGRIVRFLELPPRQGPLGETGFGLKVPMLVTSLHKHGFVVVGADHPEPFTFPLGLEGRSDSELEKLADQVMAIKRRHLAHPDEDPYRRPDTVRAMLRELSSLFDMVTWPIVRLVARRST